MRKVDALLRQQTEANNALTLILKADGKTPSKLPQCPERLVKVDHASIRMGESNHEWEHQPNTLWLTHNQMRQMIEWYEALMAESE